MARKGKVKKKTQRPIPKRTIIRKTGKGGHLGRKCFENRQQKEK